MFANRIDAANRLTKKLLHREMKQPLVLAIPRGGVVTGEVLAEKLGAELDIVLVRKLHAPNYAEYAIGAVGEDGSLYLNKRAIEILGISDNYLQVECSRQFAEIARRQELIREVRPQAPIKGRTVLVTDDGLATGSTMLAALQVIRSHDPYEVIVAVPVASPDAVERIRPYCDEIVCVLKPDDFHAVGQFHIDFPQVEDSEVIRLLRKHAPVEASNLTPQTPSLKGRGET